MHIEFLIEDASGKIMLERLLPKLLDANRTTYNIHSYKGIGGKIPQGFKNDPEKARHRILLDNLPRLLSGFGKTFKSYGPNYAAAVVVVCDLDRHNKAEFENELSALLSRCTVRPQTYFCLAIEEGEAWFLGDKEAIMQAYPHCNASAGNAYIQDSICGTWEVLADMLCKGGHQKLMADGFVAIGKAKATWAQKITPYMDMERNISPSFRYFTKIVRQLV